MDDDSIKFNANEQNCLAMLCEVMGSIAWRVSYGGTPLETQVDRIAEITERFPSVNWGELYDKFHRQGVNR